MLYNLLLIFIEVPLQPRERKMKKIMHEDESFFPDAF